MQIAIGNKIAAGFAAALLVLAVIGVFSYRSTVQFVEDSGRAARSRKVIGELKELLSYAQDLELGSRGYVVTGNDAFLDPHRNASSVIERQQAVLTDLLASDDAQRGRLETLKSLVAEKISHTGRAIDLRKNDGSEAASALIKTGRGKRIMDNIRKLVAEMEAAENEALNRQDKLAQSRGLGLSICKAIVAAHGGTISVASEVGRGTTITVRLRADLPEPLAEELAAPVFQRAA